MTEAKYELQELEINEGSLVDKGDNPEAHVLLFKREQENAPRGLFRKLWSWAVSGTQKASPETAFAELRLSLLGEVEAVMDNAATEDIDARLAKAVAEHIERADKLTEKHSPEWTGHFSDLLDRMARSVSSPEEQGADRAEFVKAIAELESFSFSMAEEKTMQDAEKMLDAAPPSPPVEVVEVVAVESEKAKAETKGSGKEPEKMDHEEEEEMKEETQKTAEAIEKRMVELEKRAQEAEAQLAKMLDEKRGAEFAAKAKTIVPAGVDHAELGAALKAAHDHSSAEGERLERLFSALAAQVQHGELLAVAGSEAPVGKAHNAHERLEAIAAEIVKASGGKVSHAAAYDQAMTQNPELAAEAIG